MAGNMSLRAAIVCAMLLPAWALAETLQPLPPLRADPTRPPESMLAGEAINAGAAGGNRLTSIVLPQHGRPTAVVDGQVLGLGQKLGEARLTLIKENKVVLEGPDGIEHLYLTPDVDKKMNITKGAVRRKKE
ncbi:MAG: hypothetical protein H6943_04440 [Zoogloeaceae bacterium]|nr:hypothetical protein [Zoogloeaceae bacterium]